MSSSELTWCWYAMNMAEDYESPVPEHLAAKFRARELTLLFKQKVDEAVAAISESLGLFNIYS